MSPYCEYAPWNSPNQCQHRFINTRTAVKAYNSVTGYPGTRFRGTPGTRCPTSRHTGFPDNRRHAPPRPLLAIKLQL
eukprot:2041148-Rhodomonas_salina.1